MSGSVLLLESDAALSDILSEALSEEQLAVGRYTTMNQLLAAVEDGRGDVAVLDPAKETDLAPGANGDHAFVRVADRIPTIVLSTYAGLMIEVLKNSASSRSSLIQSNRPRRGLQSHQARHKRGLRTAGAQARLKDQASLTWTELARAHVRIADSQALVRTVRARLEGRD